MNRIASIATIAVALAGLSACNVVRDTNRVVDQVTNNQTVADQAVTVTAAPDVAPVATLPAAEVSGQSPAPTCTALGCAAGPTLPPASPAGDTCTNPDAATTGICHVYGTSNG